MNSLYISKYKNINTLSMDELRKVNLVVGKNNVGKSTLLEALSIYLSNGSEDNIRRILYNRGEIGHNSLSGYSIDKVHYQSLFYGREENYSRDYQIVIGQDKDKDNIKISQVFLIEKEDTFGDGSIFHKRMALSQEEIDTAKEVLDNVITGLAIISPSSRHYMSYSSRGTISRASDKSNFAFVHTNDFKSNFNATLYDRIALSTEEQYIIDALNIINPDIERISFIKDENSVDSRIPIVTLKGSSHRYRLSSMGDGINRILTIILALLNCKDSVFLLDEFETGLHYSVQGKLWDIIFMLAEKLNIQVFATSHSSDCIASFANANNGNGQLIRLEERNQEIIPVLYKNNDDILYASEHYIELR